MKRVVVTRSEEDVDRLAERLTSDGHLPVKLPLLAIEPLQSSLDIENLPRTTTAIIYTSVNAVRHGFEAISQATPNERLVTIAVGAKTRDALGEKGVRAESPAREDSEGILAFLASLDQSPTHVVLVKGQGGRDLIETRLARLGVHLTIIECYRRIWPDVPLSLIHISDPRDLWISRMPSSA